MQLCIATLGAKKKQTAYKDIYELAYLLSVNKKWNIAIFCNVNYIQFLQRKQILQLHELTGDGFWVHLIWVIG
jgi:hypothetical protein